MKATTFLFLSLLVFRVLSTTLAKRSNTCRFDLLDDGCSINKDCDTIRCKTKLMDKAITYKLKVNNCDDPVSVTASMDVPDLHISWSHTYTSDDNVKVPEFNASVPGGVYVQVNLTPYDDRLGLKVMLWAGGKINSKGIKGTLPIKTDECDPSWWDKESTAIKVMVIITSLIAFISLCSCCCCCCCRCCSGWCSWTVLTPTTIPFWCNLPIKCLLLSWQQFQLHQCNYSNATYDQKVKWCTLNTIRTLSSILALQLLK